MLGEIYQITTSRQGPFPPRIADVGVVKDLATHDFDLTPWIAGSPYVRITAQSAAQESGRENEDMVVGHRPPGQRRHRQPPGQLALARARSASDHRHRRARRARRRHADR